MSRIAVGMSGGVDSTITAALLKNEGHEVEGVTLRLLPAWLEEESSAVADAAVAASELGIVHHVVDLRTEFEKLVLKPFAETYAKGSTPNPCVFCNESIKFGLLFDWAMEQGFDTLATGHYVRIVEHEGRLALARPQDESKDQSYFMYRLEPDILSKLMFPLADMDKSEVKKLARERGLSVSNKPESQDICFASACSHTEIVEHYEQAGTTPGPIYNRAGELLGEHKGLINYTIGQRKGLPAGLSTPHYVIEIDTKRNALIIGEEIETFITEVELESLVGNLELGKSYDCQLRYRMKAQRATVIELDAQNKRAKLKFDEALSAIASGQSAVCYSRYLDTDIRIGGGIISCAD